MDPPDRRAAVRLLPSPCTSVICGNKIGYLPNEIIHEILTYLDVNDLLQTSRVNHHLRTLALTRTLHSHRLHQARLLLPPLLSSPSRPSLADLTARHIFLTPTNMVSRRLARSLVSISLSRRLARRPSPDQLVQRAVLPPECMPGKCGGTVVAPALVARRREVERERVKDGLRAWVGSRLRGEVDRRSEGVKKEDRRKGVGRVWKLRRFWETVGRDALDSTSHS